MKNQNRLRVAVLWHDTLVTESVVGPKNKVTIGELRKNTLVIPDLADIGDRYLLFSPERGGGFTLHLSNEMKGKLFLDEEISVEEAREKRGSEISIDGENWGMLDLGPLAIFFQLIGEKEKLPQRPFWARMEPSVLASLLTALILHLGILITAFMLWDVNALVEFKPEENRFLQILMEEPPPEIEEEEIIEEEEDEEVGKKAGGEEGKFGEEDKIEESKVPKRDGEMVDKIKDIGVHKALSSNLLGKGALKNVFGNQTGFADQLNAAMAGADDGSLIIGHGHGGMGLRGTGSGGGGTGFGRIHGMGRIDTGGGRGVKGKLRKKGKRKKKVRARAGRGTVSAFCKEKDILRVVNARQRGISYCYEKELAKNPELAGKVTISWRIAMNGKVQKVIVVSSTLGSKKVEACMKRSIQRWSFPRPEGGMCQIRFPFVFSSGL